MSPNRLQERFHAKDLDHPHDIVGEDKEAHLGVDPVFGPGEEVGGSHSGFERAEGVFGDLSDFSPNENLATEYGVLGSETATTCGP